MIARLKNEYCVNFAKVFRMLRRYVLILCLISMCLPNIGIAMDGAGAKDGSGRAAGADPKHVKSDDSAAATAGTSSSSVAPLKTATGHPLAKTATAPRDTVVFDHVLVQSDPFLTKISDQLETRTGKDAKRIVGVKCLEYLERFTYRNREALLPAIIDRIGNDSHRIGVMIPEMADYCKEYYETYKTHTKLQNPHANKFIVGGVVFKGDYNEKNQHVYHLKPNEKLQNISAPAALCGFSLTQGTMAMIVWSDGVTQIIINEADKALLNELSEDQIRWIINCYRSGWDTRQYSYDDFCIFATLPRFIQQNLTRYYQIKPCRFNFDRSRIVEFLCDIAARYEITDGALEFTNLNITEIHNLSKFASQIHRMAKKDATQQQIEFVASLYACNDESYKTNEVFASLRTLMQQSIIELTRIKFNNSSHEQFRWLINLRTKDLSKLCSHDDFLMFVTLDPRVQDYVLACYPNLRFDFRMYDNVAVVDFLTCYAAKYATSHQLFDRIYCTHQYYTVHDNRYKWDQQREDLKVLVPLIRKISTQGATPAQINWVANLFSTHRGTRFHASQHELFKTLDPSIQLQLYNRFAPTFETPASSPSKNTTSSEKTNSSWSLWALVLGAAAVVGGFYWYCKKR